MRYVRQLGWHSRNAIRAVGFFPLSVLQIVKAIRMFNYYKKQGGASTDTCKNNRCRATRETPKTFSL
jgi:hypothetical protein